MPKYPRYIRGTMRLFFSSGQVVDLKLRSNDLRTAIKPKNFSTTQLLNSSTLSRNYRYLANGRKVVVGEDANLRKTEAVRKYLPYNK
jgi:hypothetical protein